MGYLSHLMRVFIFTLHQCILVVVWVVDAYCGCWRLLWVGHDINSFSRLIESDGVQIVVSLVLHLELVIIVDSRFVEVASDGMDEED